MYQILILECVYILSDFSCVQFLDYQAPLSMGFSMQEYWSEWPCPPPRDLPNSGIEPKFLISPALAADSLPLVPPGKPSTWVQLNNLYINKYTCIGMY